MLAPLSAVEAFVFRGRTFFVKRDDTVDPLLSGNKYRKLYALIHTPSTHCRRLYSYGGTQSNAMLSIAALCAQKGWEFIYYTKPLGSHLRAHPTGNLKAALELGMKLVEVSHERYDETVASLKGKCNDDELLLPQGGADPLARQGIERLAVEITSWLLQQGVERCYIVTPSGTGTTAYYLAGSLPHLPLITTAVVGNGEYLREQMERLGTLPKNLMILESGKKHHFAKPYAELYETYRELQEAGMEFDLIYGAKMWHELLKALPDDAPVLYIHSGGLIGNETMLERYRYKGMCR